jgi:hypothetical protein
MENLKKYELTGEPPKVLIDMDEELKLLDLNFSLLEKTYTKLKEKLKNNKNNKIEVDTLSKLRYLLNKFDCLINNVDDTIVSLDNVGKWKLTHEDIDRINCNRETNELFKTFLPLMLTYNLYKNSNTIDDNNNIDK